MKPRHGHVGDVYRPHLVRSIDRKAAQHIRIDPDRKIKHRRGAPCYPVSQGKIERWHRTFKNRILFEN
jgi:hypothetical protein